MSFITWTVAVRQVVIEVAPLVGAEGKYIFPDARYDFHIGIERPRHLMFCSRRSVCVVLYNVPNTGFFPNLEKGLQKAVFGSERIAPKCD